MWAWAYTPEVTASSATWNFTKLASYNGAAGFMPYCCMIGPYNSGLGQSVTTPGLAYDWIYSKFNDASDLSPNLNVYQKKLKGWWWLDTNLSVPNYTWDSSDGYFNVPATETAFRIDNTIDPSFNCLNFEGIGQGSFAWFIVDKNNNLVKSYQTPGKWYLTYTEPWFGSPTYSSNLPLSGLAQNKKYSLIIQDYRLFTGSMGGPVFVSFNYVVTDFCYGNCAPPAAPSNASASISSCSKINLSWQDNSNNETIFKIERKTDSTGWTQITTVGPNITSYPDSGLAENTKYYYHIIAYNEYGDSGYSNEAINTTYICPWVDLKVNGSDNPTINYNDNVPINWDTNGITTCDASGDWSGSKAIPNGSEQTGNLTSDKTYILNCNGPGDSKSDTVNVNVNPPGAPNPTLTGRSLPTSPFVDGPISITSGNSVTLKWEPTNNPTSCVASGNAQWSALTSDVLKVAGQTTINNVTAGTIFNLSCTIAGVSGTDFFEVKILDANLTHAPASGTAGVTSFSFTATVTAGITSGTFKYEFYCNDTDPNPVIPAVTNPASSFTASNICIYPTPGSKTAKVIVSHSDGWVTAKTNITVNACVPNSITPCGNGSCTGTKTCNSSGTGYGNCSTSGNTCASATDCKNVSVCDTSGSCSVQTNKANGTACTSDSNSCTDDTCSAGTCIHPAISGTHKECSGPTCVSVANTSLMCTDGCASNVTCSAGNTIDITINGKGTVSSVPSGTPASDCTASCTKAYTSGQTVTLTPINTSAGYKFKEWQGDCDSKPGNQCKVAMDGNPKAVTAIFSFTPWWKEIIPW
jgi:hypothetical protein